MILKVSYKTEVLPAFFPNGNKKTSNISIQKIIWATKLTIEQHNFTCNKDHNKLVHCI